MIELGGPDVVEGSSAIKIVTRAGLNIRHISDLPLKVSTVTQVIRGSTFAEVPNQRFAPEARLTPYMGGVRRELTVCSHIHMYRGTSRITNRYPPWDPPRTLGIGRRSGPSGLRFLVGEVAL